MTQFGWPVCFALLVWWLGTAITLLAVHLPRRMHFVCMAVASAAAVVGLAGLWATRDDVSRHGVFAAFTCAVVVWGWHEIGFFTGAVTGPGPLECPPGAVGWARFRAGVRACLHHEVAILISLVVVVGALWGGANRVGMWTFVVLFAMRQSAKLNVFLGVRNLGLELLPAHLTFVRGYMTRKPMNPLFPVSVAVSTAAAVWTVAGAAARPDAAGNMLVATMLIVGLVEHWLLVLPLPATAMWRWSVPKPARARLTWSRTTIKETVLAPALAREGDR